MTTPLDFDILALRAVVAAGARGLTLVGISSAGGCGHAAEKAALRLEEQGLVELRPELGTLRAFATPAGAAAIGGSIPPRSRETTK